jgi:hypothetical protein
LTDALGSLLRASHLLAPHNLAAASAAEARRTSVRETVPYLADYEQSTTYQAGEVPLAPPRNVAARA